MNYSDQPLPISNIIKGPDAEYFDLPQIAYVIENTGDSDCISFNLRILKSLPHGCPEMDSLGPLSARSRAGIGNIERRLIGSNLRKNRAKTAVNH